LSADARIGCCGLPEASLGSVSFISFQTSLETVQAFPFRSMLNAVTSAAFVPTPIVAAIGCPASM
jgi:hypothetical protein